MRKFIKSVKAFFVTNWQVIIGAIIVFTLVFGLFGYRLGDLTSGLSSNELQFVESSLSSEKILDNPTNIPQKGLIFAIDRLGLISNFSVRFISALLSMLTILLIFQLLRKWHTTRVTIFSCVLLTVSSWFVGVGRLATAQILLVLGVTLIIYVAEIIDDKNKHDSVKTILLVALGGLSLYIPGLIWLFLGMLTLKRKSIISTITNLKFYERILGCLVVFILLFPVIVLSISDIEFLKNILVIPVNFEPTEWLRRLVVIPIYLFAQGPLDPSINLSRLPLLDIFSSVLFLFGLYAYYFKQNLTRTKLIGVLLAVSAIIIAIDGHYFMPLLIPLVFIVIASGVELLIQQWLTIFPKNPLAQKLGVSLVVITIMLTGFYHIQRYFVAWTGSPETHEEFIHSLD
ncbi:MAG: glycosyltransferase family 39 protein [bacterium]|nr:glycosyltransferase family 39 protein [bacterium]